MRSLPRNILRPVCVSVAVAFLTYVTVFILSCLLVPVERLEVHGNRMVPDKEVLQAVPDRTSLLTLNLWSLRRQLQADPWVKGVSVLRDWHSGIVTVKVEERRAVMNGALDGRQVVLAADGTELPGLGGADLETVRLQEDRLQEIVRAVKVLQSRGVTLDSVDGVGPGGIEATVQGHRIIFSGRVEEEQARALGRLLHERPEAGAFDLRSPDRVVVAPPNG